MKAISFASLVTLLLFFSSCESENAQPVNTLGTEVELSMTEFIDQDARNLTLKFLTRKDFPCINYQIKHQLFTDNQAIRIVLEKVEKSEVCLDAIGPASAFVEIGDLTNNDYDLTIQLGESIIKSGTLTVSKDSYSIDMHEEDGVMLANAELLRIPQQTIWGSIKYDPSEEKKDLVKHFDNFLKNAGANDKKFSEGDYGYFKVGANGKVLQSTGSQKIQGEYAFLFDYKGDTEDLQAALKQITQRYQDVQIRIYDNQGREFRNWNLN